MSVQSVSKIEVGQRIVYKGDMANEPGNGAVVAVVATGIPAGRMFSMNFGAGKLEAFDSSVAYDVILDDGRKFDRVFNSNIGGEFGNKSCRFMWAEGVASAEEIAGLEAAVALKKASDDAKAAAEAAAKQKAQAEALAAGLALGLIPAEEFGKSGKRGSAAAYNLRLELKKAGIKARVNQRDYNCINVWVSEAQLADSKKIADKYQDGYFDGMQDMHVSAPSPWGRVFGDVDYLFVYRERDGE